MEYFEIFFIYLNFWDFFFKGPKYTTYHYLVYYCTQK